MQGTPRERADDQLLLILQPIVRCGNRDIGYAEHATLHLKDIPEIPVIRMKAKGGARGLLHLPRGEKVVEMGVGVQDADDSEAEPRNLTQNVLRRPARIDDNRLLRHRITDDGTVAPERGNWKSLANHA